MPVADAVQTFVGIANENEFFSHHYLAQVFRGNIKDTLDRWNTVEEGNHDQRSPVKTLAGCTKDWFINLNRAEKTREPETLLELFRERHEPLLKSLGWKLQPHEQEISAGTPIPVWHASNDEHGHIKILIIPAYRPEQEDDILLEHSLDKRHYSGIEVPNSVMD